MTTGTTTDLLWRSWYPNDPPTPKRSRQYLRDKASEACQRLGRSATAWARGGFGPRFAIDPIDGWWMVSGVKQLSADIFEAHGGGCLNWIGDWNSWHFKVHWGRPMGAEGLKRLNWWSKGHPVQDIRAAMAPLGSFCSTGAFHVQLFSMHAWYTRAGGRWAFQQNDS